MLPWKKNLYTVWLTQFLSLLGFGFGLPFLPFYIQDLGITDPASLKIWTAWLTSAPAIALAVMAPVWGLLADRLGKKVMLIRAMLGAVLVLIGMGVSQSAWMVLLFRILQGLLTGTVTSSSALVASGTPDRNLSYALGFLSSSTFIGYSLGPAVGGLIAEQFGYRISFFVGAGIVFIGLMLVLLFIEEPNPLMAANGQSSGKPAGNTGKGSSPAVMIGKSSAGMFSGFIIMLFLLFFFIRISRVMPTPFLPLYIQEMRGSVEGSARITGLLSGGIALAAAVSGLTLSRLGDRMDRLKLLSILVGAGALCSVFIPIIGGFTTVIISLLATYIFIGGVEPLLMSLTSEQVNPEKRGALFGVQTAVGSAAWFFSPLIASRAALRWSIDAVFACFSVLLILTWLVSIMVRRRVDTGLKKDRAIN